MLGLENLVSFRTLLVSKQHYPISNEMPDRFCVCVRVSTLLACALLKLLLPQGVHFVSADFKPKNWDAALRSLFPNNFWSHFDLQNYATSLQGYMQLYLKIFGNYFGVAARSFVGVTQSRSPLVPRRGEGGAAGQPATHGIRTAYAWLLRRHCMWRMAMRRASDGRCHGMPHGRCARHDRLRRFCTIAQSQQLGETETSATNETNMRPI